MTKARPNPFGPAAGNSMPLIAAAGSVVGLPSASIAQSCGMGCPAAAARRIFPMAVALSAMSASTGNSPVEGSATAMGLLPTMASAPPGAGINGRVLDSTMPTQLCSAIMRAKRPAVPK